MDKTFEQGLDEIAKLAEYFRKNRSSFLAPDTKEAQVRQNLIDPMFEALGWDVGNKNLVAPNYREVVIEKSMDIEGQRKAPDYAFRVGTLTRFYAEAKKCGVNIEKDPLPAFQLRRYAWSSKLPLSILTDFEEFSVYDCTLRPGKSDKVSHGRINYYSFEEYPDKWREIWDIFSRDAVWSGSFDNFAGSKRGKRGSTEVDAEFLKDIESWRDVLARNIAIRNPGLSLEDLNRGVQLFIDRIIFLRMAEDRGLETYEILLNISESGDIYKRFIKDLCAKADAKYNSGLFDLKADKIFNNIIIDDKVLKPILQSLYFEFGSPYEFSAIPVEILGTVYERFLGRTITLTKEHRARIEEKPEVRKAGGVYYTPSYIVDYIVKNTVGKMIEGKSPQEIRGEKRGKDAHPFRVLDMACGSGSFLLGAYQCLLEHYLKWYSENKPEKYRNEVYQKTLSSSETQWQLTVSEKKRILTTHIFGVDIDRQAVEVTKLSLLLKVLEGEDDESLVRQLDWISGINRALPNLDKNIKCGNSLIGTDYFTGTIPPDPDELKRINPFDWNLEFPEAMKSGGFDCVIGNPPYFSLSILDEKQKEHFSRSYKNFDKTGDIYCLFFEKSLKILKEDGLLSFITSNQWLQTKYGKVLRQHFVSNSNPELLINFGGLKIFQDATVDTSIFITKKMKCEFNLVACHFKNDYIKGSSIDEYISKNQTTISNLENEKWFIGSDSSGNLKEKIKRNSVSLRNSNLKIYRGILTGLNDAFIIDSETKEKLCKEEPHSAEIFKPILRGRDVHKYSIEWAGLWLIVAKNGIDIQRNYKVIFNHLSGFGNDIKNRYDQGDYWWNLRSCSYYENFEKEKIIYPETTVRRSEFFLDRGKIFIDKTCFMITGEDLAFINGILSSRLMEWYMESELRLLGKRSIQYSKIFIENVPVHKNDLNNQSEKKLHNDIVKHVEIMLSLHKQLAFSNSVSQKEIIQRQIDATDAEIDRLVYELYGLNKEEIAIIEEKRY